MNTKIPLRFLGICCALAVLLALPGVANAGPLDPAPNVGGSTTSPSCLPPPSGLAAWYPFNGSAADAAGANHATISGTASFAPGAVGNALQFDGTTTSAKAVASPALDVGTGDGLTIEAWISPADATTSYPIVEWNNAAAGGVFGTHLFISETFAGGVPGGLFLNLNDKTDTPHVIRSTAAVISAQTYQHVAATYDRTTGNATLYLNGVPLAVNGSTTPGPVNLGIFTPQTAYDLYLGHRPSFGDPNGGRRYNGALDEVGIYNRALSQAEIQAIFNSGSAGKCGGTAGNCVPVPTDLNGWYSGEGDAADIQSYNGGTLKNGATFAPGKVGQAFSLDGADDFVEIPHKGSLNNPPRITLAAWIKPDTVKAGSRIISKDSSATTCTAPTVNYSLEVRGLQGNKADFFFTTGDKVLHELVGSSVIPTGVFTHVAATYDGTTAKIYVNGVLENSLTVGGSSLARSSAPVIIGSGGAGCRASNGGQIEFDGLIDEVQLYKRALSESEISAIVNAGSAGTCNRLAFTNGSLWSAGPNLFAHEKPDSAAEVNATNSKVPEWSYGYRSVVASTDLTLFTPAQHLNFANGPEGWITGNNLVAVNGRGVPLVLNAGGGDYRPLLPSMIITHPGSFPTVVRWTAPEAGDYRVLAQWMHIDPGGNGVTASLIRNGQAEIKNTAQETVCVDFDDCSYSETFQTTASQDGVGRLRSRTLRLNSGDTLDFVLGANGSEFGDSTAFNAAIRRVPRVTITSPATGTQVTAEDANGGVLTFTVDVQHNRPITQVYLQVDDLKGGPSDFTAPFSLSGRLKLGYHRVTVIATDEDEVEAESAPIAVTILPPPPPPQQNVASKGQTKAGSSKAAVQPPTYFYHSVRSGSWYDPGTWGSTNGGSTYPLRWDYAEIQSGHEVFIPGGSGDFRDVQLRGLTVDGRLFGTTDPAIAERDTVFLYGTLQLEGQLDNLKLFINGPAGKFLYFGKGVIKDVDFVNQSEFRVTANQFNGEGVTIENRGTIKAGPKVATQGPLAMGGIARLDSDGPVELETNAIVLPDRIVGAPIRLNNLIFNNGASTISNNGAGVLSHNGGTMVAAGSLNLIGNDGSTLIGNDGSTLVAGRAPAILPTAGGNMRAPEGASVERTAAAAESANIILTGGTVTGSGELHGNVVNQGAFIAPGDSAGGIFINGNYTQESAGTLVLEVGGNTLDPVTYDVLQVAGTANLGGKLVVKTIDGYTPASGETVSPLLFSSVAGNFDSVSSNAQISFGANGMTTQVSGPNPPAPKALNIATRMKVETGDNALIAGFIITGSQPKKVIIRGIGPSLPFGGILADPNLSLDNGAVTNDNWRTDQEQEIIGTTIPPSNDLESAIVATLIPGPHTAILRGSGDATGIGVVEVYDLESGSPVQLANISSRGLVQTGDDVMIGGFIIGGTYPAKVIVRAIGPSLPFTGKLEDPTLELVDQNGGRISNDNWRETQEAELIATTIPPTNDNEAAIVATLAPGQYTAIVRGVDDTTGIAVVEAYNLQ